MGVFSELDILEKTDNSKKKKTNSRPKVSEAEWRAYQKKYVVKPSKTYESDTHDDEYDDKKEKDDDCFER
ncbi:MAG: hypothetical protein GX682_05060 [Clostridiaceae bacterium]|nr:hypothetical protein [Clostridiaceae bacterium]